MDINTDLDNLENLVRNGVYPDSPAVLSCYLDIAEDLGASILIPQQQWLIFNRVALTLMEVIYDKNLCTHWRELCLDNIYRPILKLQSLSKTNQEIGCLRKLQYQLTSSAKHFYSPQ